jgi:hypothetical protein
VWKKQGRRSGEAAAASVSPKAFEDRALAQAQTPAASGRCVTARKRPAGGDGRAQGQHETTRQPYSTARSSPAADKAARHQGEDSFTPPAKQAPPQAPAAANTTELKQGSSPVTFHSIRHRRLTRGAAPRIAFGHHLSPRLTVSLTTVEFMQVVTLAERLGILAAAAKPL